MVWGKPATGAWASAVEQEEEEHGKIQAPVVKEAEFPTLGAAVTVKETKKKKKQTMSLADFNSAVGGGIGRSSSSRGDDVLLHLPKAPRQLAEGETDERPTGGYRSQGGGERGGGRYGGDEERRPRREDADADAGRADAVDSWGAERKFVPSGGIDSYGGRDRGGGFGGGGGFRDREQRDSGGFGGERRGSGFEVGPSRADNVDNWGASRQFVPSSSSSSRMDSGPRRGSLDDRMGGGFRDGGSLREREPFREPSKADVEEKWERGGGDIKPTGFDDRPRRVFEGEPPRRGFANVWRGREQVGDSSRERSTSRTSRDSDQDQWRRREAPPAGGDAPRERPKLNLKPRSADAAGAPAAAPAAAAPAAAGAPRSSVFGAARPREEVLKEQGRDPVREDLQLEHKAAERRRKETPQEAALRARIAEARAKAAAGTQAVGEGGAQQEQEQEPEQAGSEGEGSEAEGKSCEGGPGSASAAPCGGAAEVEALEAELTKLQLQLDDEAKYARVRPDKDSAGRERDNGGHAGAASRGASRDGGRDGGEADDALGKW